MIYEPTIAFRLDGVSGGHSIREDFADPEKARCRGETLAKVATWLVLSKVELSPRPAPGQRPTPDTYIESENLIPA